MIGPRQAGATLVRYTRRTRRFHAGVYLLTSLLLATGWWLLLGREGQPSPLALLVRLPDVELHKWTGWALTALGVAVPTVAWGAVGRFLRESVRFRSDDRRWLAHWPVAVFTGRFHRHEGHFDPGQRLANLLIAGLMVVVVGSGIVLVAVHGGPVFVWATRLHRWATYLLTPLLAGHVLVASGVLPGYRGAWRSMHGRGIVPEDTARRLWPGWTERQERLTSPSPPHRQQEHPG